ncbi:hypothetical protein BJ165DRAFT_1408444 [Panaeolus papilionaceus]|nr:hypothetical protein BJ165DRAFT_1408444 [Panaeolus papilionaceus]
MSTAGHAWHFKGYVWALLDSVVNDSSGSSSPYPNEWEGSRILGIRFGIHITLNVPSNSSLPAKRYQAWVGAHADSLIAEAVLELGGTDGHVDLDLTWEANVDYEVHAGLSSVCDTHGWVADDVHSESASRTLDYAHDGYAAYILARELNKSDATMVFLLEQSLMAPYAV